VPIVVKLGGNTFNYYVRADSVGYIDVLSNAGLPWLSALACYVTLRNGRLLVSIDARSWDGRLAGRLRDNEWQTSNSNFDRNFNDRALEIIDQYGLPVLQVMLETSRTVRVQGFLFTPDGVAVVDTGGIFTMHLPRSMRELEELKEGAGKSVRPWFRYPSKEHPSELGPDAPIAL